MIGRARVDATLLVVTWNGRRHLQRNLRSVVTAASRAQASCEVLVVDNASTDGTPAWLRGAFPSVRVLRLARNEGFGGGNNRGAQAAQGRWLIFLNTDVRVAPDFVDPLLAHLTSPDVFAVGAKLEALGGPRHETGLTRARLRRGLVVVEHRREDYAVAVPALYPSGAACAVDRDKFLALGGFEALYAPFYWEDADLGWRAWQRGWRVLWEPRSVAAHARRGTIGRFAPRWVERVNARNRWLFTWRTLRDRDLWVAHLAWMPLRLLGAVLRGDWRELAGFGWALGRLPRVWELRRAERGLRRSDRALLRVTSDPLAHPLERAPDGGARGRQRLKVLWLCPYLPREGAHGGAARMLALIRELARRHELWVISFATVEERPTIEALRACCHHLDVVPRPGVRADRLSRVPAMAQEFAHPEMAALIRRRLVEEAFDIVQCEYLAMAQYAPAQYVGATVLTEHQVHGAASLRDLTRLPMGWRWLRVLGSALKTVAYELPMCGRFDGVISLTPHDARRLRASLAHTSLAVIPTGVDCERMRQDGVQPVRSDLLYVGYFGHAPNVDAARWFAARMWPRIRRRRPDATWTIVGSEAAEAVGQLAAHPGVRVVGWVPDLRPYLAGCGVCIVPVRLGGGIRGKLMDAWAMGCAVVSTSRGCEGTAARDGRELLVADAPGAFAGAVLRLLEDEPLRRALGAAGRRHVEENFDWASLAEAHARFYAVVLQRTGRREGAASEPDEVAEAAGAVLGDRHA